MNTAAETWVQALESGKFSQTHYKLRDSKGYCCLGVACELALKAGIINSFQAPKERGMDYYVYEGQTGTLPKKVCNWLGLKCPDGGFSNEGGDVTTLAFINDERHTFKEIAAVIRSKPKGLFKKPVKKGKNKK